MAGVKDDQKNDKTGVACPAGWPGLPPMGVLASTVRYSFRPPSLQHGHPA